METTLPIDKTYPLVKNLTNNIGESESKFSPSKSTSNIRSMEKNLSDPIEGVMSPLTPALSRQEDLYMGHLKEDPHHIRPEGDTELRRVPSSSDSIRSEANDDFVQDTVVNRGAGNPEQEQVVTTFAAIELKVVTHCVTTTRSSTPAFATTKTSSANTIPEASASLPMKSQKPPTGVKYPAPQKPLMRPAVYPKSSKGLKGTEDKWAQFVREPITGKKISSVPGLGGVFMDTLEAYNKKESNGLHYTKISHLLAKYLMLDMNEKEFKSWLRDEVKVPTTQLINTCYNAMRDWWNSHNVTHV